MPSGYKQIMAEHDGFNPVADTTSALTWDFEKAEMVMIVADVVEAIGIVGWKNLLSVGQG